MKDETERKGGVMVAQKYRISSPRDQKQVMQSIPDRLGHGQAVVSLLLGDRVRAIGLVLIAANTLVVLEVAGHERALVRVLTHAKASNSNAIQRVHVIVCRARMLGLLGRSDRGHWAGRTWAGDRGSSHGKVMTGLAEVNVWWEFRDLHRGFHETALHGDDVVTKGVVLVKQSLNLLTKMLNALILFF